MYYVWLCIIIYILLVPFCIVDNINTHYIIYKYKCVKIVKCKTLYLILVGRRRGMVLGLG